MGEEQIPRGLVVRTAPHTGDPDPYMFIAVRQAHGYLYFDVTLGGGLTGRPKDKLVHVAELTAALLERMGQGVAAYETFRKVNLHDEGKKDEGGEAPKA